MLQPGATIGIIGGGQLGRMMALSAKYMGFRIGVLDPTPDCPTAQVADFQVVVSTTTRPPSMIWRRSPTCSPMSRERRRRIHRRGASLGRGPAGHRPAARYPGPHPREDLHQQARHRDRTLREVNTFEELDAAIDDLHYPCVLKTRSGGYDGHGQHVLRNDSDLEKIRARGDRGGGFPPSILEGFVDFAFERRFSCPATARITSRSRSCATTTATTSCI